MKSKKILNGLTAFLIASSCVSVYAGSETKLSLSLSDYISFFQNNYSGDAKEYNFDINKDNSVNILDMIYAKSSAAGETKIDADKTTVEYLNYAACDIADALEMMSVQMDVEGITLSKTEFSSDDMKNAESLKKEEREILEFLNEVAEFHGVEKWLAVLSDNGSASCIAGDEVVSRTGAYPGEIPLNLNIPYSKDLIKNASCKFVDWKKSFDKLTSSDPSLSAAADFYAVRKGNHIAYDLYTYIYDTITLFDTQGLEIPNGMISSDDNSDFVKEVRKTIKSETNCESLKWKASIDKSGSVNGVIAQIPVYDYCSAYPNTVPYKMNIPYSDKLIEYACDTKKDWEKDFPECISTDPEQLKYPERNDIITTGELNSYAKELYTAVEETITEYETRGISVDFASEEFNSKINEYISVYLQKGDFTLKYKTKDGHVTGTAVAINDAAGVYPNAVPDDMRIPYSSDILNYLSDSPEVWKEKFSDYTIESVETEASPNVKRNIKQTCTKTSKARAKSLFTAAGNILRQMEADGKKLPEGIVTSDDDSDFVKAVKAELSASYKAYNDKWAVYISNGEVKGTVCSFSSSSAGYQHYDPEKGKFVYSPLPYGKTEFTGSYPDSALDDKETVYNHNLVKIYADSSDSGQDGLPADNSGSGSETEQGSSSGKIKTVSSALLASNNANARTIYNSASNVLFEHELFDDPVSDGLITSDDNSEISDEINSSVIGGFKGKWALYVYNGEILGVVYSGNGITTGSYPSVVSTDVKYDHSLALKYKDNSMEW